MEPHQLHPAQGTLPALGKIRKVEVVINPLSGGANQDAAPIIERKLAGLGLDARVRLAEQDGVERCLQSAVDSAPDLLITLAGDGTANCAAGLCGADGPLLAPLPGGTMNLLPRALYGDLGWLDALDLALGSGAPRMIPCGDVGGERFHCAALLGAPALWGPAREAVRLGRLQEALRRAQSAWRLSFATRLRVQLDGKAPRKTLALNLICPTVSAAVTEVDALEAALLDLHSPLEVFRLGLNDILRGWRNDPGVAVDHCKSGRAWTHTPIPCLVDGEARTLPRLTTIAFHRNSFRALAPSKRPTEASP